MLPAGRLHAGSITPSCGSRLTVTLDVGWVSQANGRSQRTLSLMEKSPVWGVRITAQQVRLMLTSTRGSIPQLQTIGFDILGPFHYVCYASFFPWAFYPFLTKISQCCVTACIGSNLSVFLMLQDFPLGNAEASEISSTGEKIVTQVGRPYLTFVCRFFRFESMLKSGRPFYFFNWRSAH